ncbi:MAG: TIGR02646 family protein [Bacteroidetes bacterium]|nr:TIGR02646 family protein [Bacteroidota bacterium]MBU1115021.1 TIGR02646 family protein [Bacteroidota bacterium]MBU1799513.1 TIGR02646 family protein [Bacteroidota bacterium]
MKFIVKGSSPQIFEDWKENCRVINEPRWDMFQNPEKESVKEALLLDQGYICCYCGLRIENDPSTEIEHIKPKVECTGTDEQKAMDYDNFLASCNGSQKEPKPRITHCNNFRQNKHLVITPLNEKCESVFLYTSKGITISKDSTESIKKLIEEVLNLNATKIKNKREEILLALENDFATKSEEEVKEEIHALSQKINDRFKEMCFVSINFLQNTFL